MAEDESFVVIDLGSGLFKVGMGGEEEPLSIFPSVVEKSSSGDFSDLSVGVVAWFNEDIECYYPIERNIVKDWKGLELLVKDSVENQLGENLEEKSLIVTQSMWCSIEQTNKLKDLFIETLKVPRLIIVDPSIVSIYASGYTTLLSFICGFGSYNCITVYEGNLLVKGLKMDYGGHDITQYLMKNIKSNDGPVSYKTAQFLKEQYCYVAKDYLKELEEAKDVDCGLSDGGNIKLGSERFSCAETLFSPQLFGLEHEPIHEYIYNAIMKSPIGVRSNLYKNIFVSGGSTMFPGFNERLQIELTKLIPNTMEIRIMDDSNKGFSTWIGESILSSLSNTTSNLPPIPRRDTENIYPFYNYLRQ